jgi:hypothetical protein
LWRKLRRLGVAQLADGLVALPADARTREQLEWLADEVLRAGGTSGVWLARPVTRVQEKTVAVAMQTARTREYEHIRAEAEAALNAAALQRSRALRRLRAELRRVQRRDFFPPPARATAKAAVESLADTVAPAAAPASPAPPVERAPASGAR